MSTDSFCLPKLRERISGRLGLCDVRELARQASVCEVAFGELFRLLSDSDKRTSDNAAWVLTHLPPSALPWLEKHRDSLIDETMRTASVTKRRLTMALLERQAVGKENVRTDFLDFCFERLLDPAESYGVRSLAAKLAFKQCAHYGELQTELRHTLELLNRETLKPGLLHTQKQLLKKLKCNPKNSVF